MGWILALLGAFVGAVLGAAEETLLGAGAGALIGFLLARTLSQGSRLESLEQRLQSLEWNAAPMPAAQARPSSPTPPAPDAVSAPATPASPASPPAQAPEPRTAAPEPPPLPAAGASATAPAAAAARTGVRPPAVERAPAEPAGPDAFEKAIAIAKGWLFEGNVPVKLGLLVLMFGVAAALKYAADAGWLRLPIEYRLAGIAAAAIAGLVWGLRSAAQRPAFGLSLQGGAIGILLMTIFAAYRNYHVLPPMPAFVLVAVMVAGASVLAVRQNAVALAVLGFIGGYLAPVLLSTGTGSHVALFSYYAVLNAAVFAIAWLRPWRALNLVGFVFTFAIGGAWGAQYYRPEFFATVEPFLVLFFLFYVAIPVLYALAGRGGNGKVDGTLLFGTPLLAFPMQVGLLADEPTRLPMAISAVAVAAVYSLLALWSIRNARLRLLAQSSAAMGVVFATLAIPLALSARWTSAAWALQGFGMVWLGLRQDRRLTRWSGLLLLGLAGAAWCVAAMDYSVDRAGRFLLNGHAMNLVLLALATLGASWLYDRAGRRRGLAIVLFVVGGFWWTVFGLREVLVNLDPDSEGTAVALFAAITAALAAGLRTPMHWPRLSWPVALASVAALLLAFGTMEAYDATWFAGPWTGWWIVAALLLVALRPLRDPPTLALPVAHLAWLGMVMLGLGLSLLRLADDGLHLGEGWWLPAAMLPAALLFAAGWRWPAIAGWPVAGEFPRWRAPWLGLSGFVLGAGWLSGQFLAGDSSPLPWLPVLNPLELTLLLGLVVGAGALHRDSGKLGWALWAAASLLTLTMGVLRACHHIAELPWSPGILSSFTVQTSLTVAWCVAGVVAWVLGSRRRDRALWMVGAGLLGIVLAKLLFVDRSYLGNVTGIVSFIAVGLLLTFVGWIAPSPPRSESK